MITSRTGLPYSAIIDLADRKRAIAKLCDAELSDVVEAAVLFREGSRLSVKQNDGPDGARRALVEVRETATRLHAASSEAGDVWLSEIALRIEREAAAAIVVADRVIDERRVDREAAKSSRPVLGSRHMNLSRNGDDRR